MTDAPFPPVEEPFPLFAASYIKIDRAKKFIEELRDLLERYKHEKPPQVRPEPAEGGVNVIIYMPGIGLLPGAIIGDIVHNLRSALDLMASEMARLRNLSDKDVYFPFGDDEASLGKRIASKNFDRCGEDAAALLREFKPYKGGNDDLRAIHDLDIEDKHKTLVVTGSNFDFEIDVPIRDGTIHFGELEFLSDTRFIFPRETPLAEREVFSTLEQLVELVAGILEAFASLVAART